MENSGIIKERTGIGFVIRISLKPVKNKAFIVRPMAKEVTIKNQNLINFSAFIFVNRKNNPIAIMNAIIIEGKAWPGVTSSGGCILKGREFPGTR